MNPFRFGEVVTGQNFCPRPELIERLRSAIESGQNVAVLGERRTGKTSLIFEAVRQERGLRLVYTQLWAVKSVEDVATRLLRAVISMQGRESSFLERVVRSVSQLRPRVEFDEATGQPSITVTPGMKLPPSGLNGVFDLLQDIGSRHRIAVALDEFQDIRNVENGDALLGEIRSRIQHQTHVPYIFAGSIRHEMERIFRDPSSPFFKSLRTLEVHELPRKAFQQFLTKRFADGKRNVSATAYEQVFALAQDNPSDIQQFCSALWDVTSPGEAINDRHVQGALVHVLAAERKGYESLVRNLTNNQVRCLRTLARKGGRQPLSRDFLAEAGIPLPASLKKALTRLVNLQIVYGAEASYKFFDPFFKQWVLREL